MKKGVVILSVLLALPFLLGFTVKGLDKKIDREIKDAFEVETYDYQGVNVPGDLQRQIPSRVSEQNLFRLEEKGQLLGYAYVDQAPSKTAVFDYLVIFDKNLSITKTKVLVYREEYGGEIGSKRWLRQFNGKSKASELGHIAAISGATISVRSMKKAVKDILFSVEVLHKNNVL